MLYLSTKLDIGGITFMKTKWKDQSLHYNIFSISYIIVPTAIILLGIIQLLDIWRNAGYVYIPLIGVNLLLRAYAQWKSNRKIAIFNLCATVLVLFCAVEVYTIK